MEFLEFISQIQKTSKLLELIIILENKNEGIKNNLIAKGIFNIFYHNEITTSEIINLIEKKEINKEKIIEEEIINLKKIILENNQVSKNENKFNIKEKIKNKLKSKNIKKIRNKIITVVGTPCSGKSTFCISLAENIKTKNKIILIDFDKKQNDLSTILGKKKYSKKIKKGKIEVKNFIIRINNKIDIISGLDILFIEKNKIKNIIEKLKSKYEIIIIDTTSENKNDELKTLLRISDRIIFLLEPNLLEIKKAKNILKIYEEDWKIKKEKINLVLNKNNKNGICIKIMENIFKGNEVLGKINYDEKYNLFVNRNKKNILNKKTKKQYKEIIKKIEQPSKRKILEKGKINGFKFVRK